MACITQQGEISRSVNPSLFPNARRQRPIFDILRDFKNHNKPRVPVLEIISHFTESVQTSTANKNKLVSVAILERIADHMSTRTYPSACNWTSEELFQFTVRSDIITRDQNAVHKNLL